MGDYKPLRPMYMVTQTNLKTGKVVNLTSLDSAGMYFSDAKSMLVYFLDQCVSEVLDQSARWSRQNGGQREVFTRSETRSVADKSGRLVTVPIYTVSLHFWNENELQNLQQIQFQVRFMQWEKAGSNKKEEAS